MDDNFKAGGVAYIKLLRRVLDARGFGRVRIIAGDVHSWAPSSEVLADAELSAAVAVIRPWGGTERVESTPRRRPRV